MNIDNNNQEVIYCDNGGEYRVYCKICDKLCIEQFYKNHLKSGTHITKTRKRQQMNNMNTNN